MPLHHGTQHLRSADGHQHIGRRIVPILHIHTNGDEIKSGAQICGHWNQNHALGSCNQSTISFTQHGFGKCISCFDEPVSAHDSAHRRSPQALWRQHSFIHSFILLVEINPGGESAAWRRQWQKKKWPPWIIYTHAKRFRFRPERVAIAIHVNESLVFQAYPGWPHTKYRRRFGCFEKWQWNYSRKVVSLSAIYFKVTCDRFGSSHKN